MNNNLHNAFSDINRPFSKLPSQDNDNTLQTAKSTSTDDTISTSFVEGLNDRLTDLPMWSTSSLVRQQPEGLSRDFTVPSTHSSSFQEQKALGCLDPVKFSPSNANSSILQSSPMFKTSSSFHNLNPFKDESERCTQFGDMYGSEDQETMAKAAHVMYEGAATKNQAKPAGMSQSRSEGNIKYQHRPTISHDRNGSGTLGGFPYIRFAGEDDPPLLDRGRAVYRSPSPVKTLDDINEEGIGAAKPPSQRAQSPIKQLFGEKGWLGRSTSMKELPSEDYRKTGIKHWGGRIKEKMLGKTEDLTKMIPAAFNVHISPSKTPKVRPTTRFPVSLKPPEQAKLYSELELMLSAAANRYLMTQKEMGRMSLESVQKITQRWIEKGRPQVIEFQFDILTQRELVFMNLKTFRFHGLHHSNMMVVVTMLNTWKVMAKEMSVRTFCTPDSVIKKHMHGIYKILELLDAAFVSFVAFSQIHRDMLQLMDQRQAEKREYESIKFGIEKPWSPDLSAREGKEDLENPFENTFD